MGPLIKVGVLACTLLAQKKKHRKQKRANQLARASRKRNRK